MELDDAVVTEQPDASLSLRDKEKVWKPSACAAFTKAVAPIRLILIGPAETELEEISRGLETYSGMSGTSTTEGAMAGTEVGVESGQTHNVTLQSTQLLSSDFRQRCQVQSRARRWLQLVGCATLLMDASNFRGLDRVGESRVEPRRSVVQMRVS